MYIKLREFLTTAEIMPEGITTTVTALTPTEAETVNFFVRDFFGERLLYTAVDSVHRVIKYRLEMMNGELLALKERMAKSGDYVYSRIAEGEGQDARTIEDVTGVVQLVTDGVVGTAVASTTGSGTDSVSAYDNTASLTPKAKTEDTGSSTSTDESDRTTDTTTDTTKNVADTNVATNIERVIDGGVMESVKAMSQGLVNMNFVTYVATTVVGCVCLDAYDDVEGELF